MKPKVKSGAEKRCLKEKQQLEKVGSDPKQKKLMFFKISEICEDDNIDEITVSGIEDENNVLKKLPVSSHGNYLISIK